VNQQTRKNLGFPETAEECCLDAEAWAAELEDWVNGHLQAPLASDMSTIARMLRALVKSIRLSIVADESDDNRAYLVEELEGTIAKARELAAGLGHGAIVPRRGSSASLKPPSVLRSSRDMSTAPPPNEPDSRRAATVPELPAVKDLNAFARDVMERTSPISDLPLPPPKKKR